MPPSVPLPPVSGCLIVRDEAAGIGACLAALAPFVEEIVVADTGSADETAALAEQAGARVIEVPWTDDFAAARNAALTACRHDWVLSVDADERAVGDPGAVRELLAGTSATAVSVAFRIEGPNPRGLMDHRAVRLFRRTEGRWWGRVHEEVVAPDGTALASAPLPERALTLVHGGYADPAAFARKVARNLRLARAEVADVTAARSDDAVPPERLHAALLDLGRTELAAGLRADGTGTLAAVRDLAGAGSPAWVWASDFLAWDALRHDDLDRAWQLLGELAEHDAGERHVRPLAERLLER
jgi:glycosyltransferase involved in cell wall biosynthesis